MGEVEVGWCRAVARGLLPQLYTRPAAATLRFNADSRVNAAHLGAKLH